MNPGLGKIGFVPKKDVLSKSPSVIKDYALLGKPRLSTLVVISAVFCFVLGSDDLDAEKVWWLVAGGFLVTMSSNAFNQIIERDLDKLMDRTRNRPLPDGRLTVVQATLFAVLTGCLGTLILWFKMNPLSGVLGFSALILYSLVYTPLKKKTPFAVFVGAFPGAMPPMLGWAAATGYIGLEGMILFFVQFMWQFPHFWAIAWMLDDDYKKAGFKMLPSEGGRNKASAFQILVYTLGLLPVSLTPWLFNISGWISGIIVLICGLVFLYQAIQLYRNCDLKSAQKLMFGSFVYLPLVQMAMMFDKI
jgi:heme o synthase